MQGVFGPAQPSGSGGRLAPPMVAGAARLRAGRRDGGDFPVSPVGSEEDLWMYSIPMVPASTSIKEPLGLPAHARQAGQAAPASARVRHYDPQTAGISRLAAAEPSHPPRQGEPGRLWEADLEHCRGRWFTLTLAQAQHVKNVPGQKTDTADGVWLAQRLRHGWLPASFVPPQPRGASFGI
jgi:hypothetical protein